MLKFLFLIFLSKSFINYYGNCIDDVVEQINPWPVAVQSDVSFTINKPYNDKSEILIKIVNEKEEILSYKSVRISKKSYVDLSTDFFVIKKEKLLYDGKKFSLIISFEKKCFGLFLIMEWSVNGEKESTSQLIYREKIHLIKDWLIEIKSQVLEYDLRKNPIYVDDSRYFQPGKRVKVSCSAFDGLPPAKIYVNENLTKRFRDVNYDVSLNQWIGYLTLAIDDHKRNLTCQVRGSLQSKSIEIIVNHPTSAVKLEPEYNGYIKNGTLVTCLPLDGYPTPIMKWTFVSTKNHSNPLSLYKIEDNNLEILPSVSFGTEMEFNCSATYTNPLDEKTTTVTRSYVFIVGEKPNNINYQLYTKDQTKQSQKYANLNIAAIGAGVAAVVIMIIAVTIVIMLCRSKPKPSRSSSNQQQGSPKYAGSLLAGSKSALRNQMKSQNGSNTALMTPDSSTTAHTDQNELNYDSMPRGRRPIKVVDDPVIYSTIVGTMQPKSRPSLDLGPIDRV